MLKTAQIALNADTATPLLVQGDEDGQFSNISGSVGDPLPVLLVNIDGAIVAWIGGPDVTADNGVPLAAGESLPLSLVGAPVTDIPYAIAASDTPAMAIMVGRQ